MTWIVPHNFLLLSCSWQVHEAVPCYSECNQYSWVVEHWSPCKIHNELRSLRCGGGTQTSEVEASLEERVIAPFAIKGKHAGCLELPEWELSPGTLLVTVATTSWTNQSGRRWARNPQNGGAERSPGWPKAAASAPGPLRVSGTPSLERNQGRERVGVLY